MDALNYGVFLREEAGGPSTKAKENQTFTLYMNSHGSSDYHVNFIFEDMLNLNISTLSDKKDDYEKKF